MFRSARIVPTACLQCSRVVPPELDHEAARRSLHGLAKHPTIGRRHAAGPLATPTRRASQSLTGLLDRQHCQVKSSTTISATTLRPTMPSSPLVDIARAG